MSILGLIFFLLAGGMLAWVSQRISEELPRWMALASLFASVFFLFYLADEPNSAGIFSEYNAPWIDRFGISFSFVMDGLSLALVALTIFLGFISVYAAWRQIKERTGFFYFNLLWTLAGVVGVFTAFDLFLFFFFWEVMLIPMYFLIAIWGHENKSYAALKFFLFTQISGLFLLAAIVALAYFNYSSSGELTFNYFRLLEANLPGNIEYLLMLGFFIAFVVKLPAAPFHTWLPDAHTQAPTAGSVILAGILLKTGAYGLLRFVIPLFPEASMDFRWFAMALGAFSVVYGGYLAYSQSDFKRLVAYSSISHMGFVLLGIFAWNQMAIQGSIVQMVAHGFSSAALFMMAGELQDRLHTRDMAKMGGIWMRAPRMGATALFFVAASLGMPGLGTFVGEFLILMGVFKVDIFLTIVAALGIIIAAVYSLVLMQKTFQGSSAVGRPEDISFPDFGIREMQAMLVMAIALIILGVYPQPLLDLTLPFVDGLEGVGR